MSPTDPSLSLALSHWWAQERHPDRNTPFRCTCKVLRENHTIQPIFTSKRNVHCSRSSRGQEFFLAGLSEALLGGIAQGTFVEIGGNDGWSTSNTVFLESCSGWRGVLIEPDPRAFKMMRKARPHVLSVRAGACSDHGSVSLVRRSDSITGSQAMEQVLKQSPGRAFFRPLRWTYNRSLIERVAVPCAPLGDVFELLKLSRIDAMVVDVEGSEDELLQSIEWRAADIGLLSVELTKLNKTRNAAVLSRIQAAGFALVACIAEWRANIYDLVYLRLSHFLDNVEPGVRLRRFAAAEAWVRGHHKNSMHHDTLRCKPIVRAGLPRGDANRTGRLSFELSPPPGWTL